MIKFEKIILGELNRVYSLNYVNVDNKPRLLFASEAEGGSAISFSGDDFSKKEIIWDNAGGTMSLVEIEGTNGEFLATQGFYPGFKAETSKVVHVKYKNGKYSVKDVIAIPYLHRFDILKSDNGKTYFIGASLCTSKKEREDWSDPGKVYVGEFNPKTYKVTNLKPLIENLTKNHGYYRHTYKSKLSSFITSENGVFVVTPPQTNKPDWSYEHIITTPISDVAVLDINDDGKDEILAIAPFHGSNISIYEEKNGKYEIVDTYEHATDFAHALVGGTLNNQKVFICGTRRVDKELFYVYFDKESKSYKSERIDENIGASNVVILNTKDADYLLSANNGIGEVAIYKVVK